MPTRIPGCARRICALFALLSATCVLAGDLAFPDGLVPAELLGEVTGGGTAYRSLPQDFPLVPFPAGLRLQLIGSIKAGLGEQLLLRNAGDNQTVLEQLRAAYVGAGWLDISYSSAMIRLCDDSSGVLDLWGTQGSDGDNRVHVSLVPLHFMFPVWQTCENEFDSIHAGGTYSLYAFFREQVPVLKIPGSSTPINGFYPPSPNVPGLFRNIGSRPYLTSGYFTVTDQVMEIENKGALQLSGYDLAALSDALSSQLSALGWSSDDRAQGSLGDSSIWFRVADASGAENVEQDLNLSGILSVINAGQDSYRIVFRMFSSPDALLAP